MKRYCIYVLLMLLGLSVSGQTTSSFFPANGGGDDSLHVLRLYADIANEIAGSDLRPGVSYEITDRGDLGLVFTAVANNQLSKSGIRKMLCPKKYAIGAFDGNSWIGVWNATKTVSADDLAIWGGLVWKNTTGSIGSAVDDFTLDGTNWDLISKASFIAGDPGTADIYVERQFDVVYDFDNDWIQEQRDQWSNVVGIATPLLSPTYNPVDVTDWNSAFGGGTIITFNAHASQGIYNNEIWLSPGVQGFITQNISGLIKNNFNMTKINYNRAAWIIDNHNTGAMTYNSQTTIVGIPSSVTDYVNNNVDNFSYNISFSDTPLSSGDTIYFNCTKDLGSRIIEAYAHGRSITGSATNISIGCEGIGEYLTGSTIATYNGAGVSNDAITSAVTQYNRYYVTCSGGGLTGGNLFIYFKYSVVN